MSEPIVSDHEEEKSAEASVEEVPAEASAEGSAAEGSAAEASAAEGSAAEGSAAEGSAAEPSGESAAKEAEPEKAEAEEGEKAAEEATADAEGEATKEAPSSALVEVSPTDDDEEAERIFSGEDLSLDEKVLFYKERECLLLLLEARKLLCSMITRREAITNRLLEEKRLKEEEERRRGGRLSVQEIQAMLQNSADDDDYDMVSEIQELKKKLVIAVRQNHKLERDLAKLDKRIALLIKNRTSLQDVIAASKGLKSQKKSAGDAQMDAKKLEHYQDLFYLLQTEPRYLARCVYMISQSQLETFLETVILTLFGDSANPREEFLILSLFRLAMEREISVIKNLGDFIGGQSETVVPKMIHSYTRRKQGLDYLKSTLSPLLEAFIKSDVNLEFNPRQVYQTMIGEYEIRTGEPSPLDKNATAEEAAANSEVVDIISKRQVKLEEVCQTFVDGIVRSLDNLPYGLRWLCKQLRELCLKTMPDTTEDDITKVTVYFVYYRFVNLAIVTPDAFNVIEDTDLPAIARKNLVIVSKVLQKLFNFRLFDDAKPGEKYYCVMNAFIEKNMPFVREYIETVYKVDEPEERLQVNKYMELAQKAKPIIIISLDEIYRTHTLLTENLDELAPEKDDNLRIVLNDLGEPPSKEEHGDERELQLTLTNRFKVEMDEEAEHTRLYAETKELVIPILRLVPVQNSIHRLNLMDVLEAGIKYATETNNNQLKTQIKKILENLGRLENAEVVSKDDNYESFVHDVALEVANRTSIRESQRKEVTRLKGTLEELHDHQSYVDESIKSYQSYLQDCKEKQYLALALKKKKGKKGKKGAASAPGAAAANYSIAPVKFSYKDLVKKRVIIDSEVPAISRKKTNFIISSDQPGVFSVQAKIAGLSVDTMELDLDDLLERHYNNVTRLELDQVTLDVNMTIHLINKAFLS